MNSQGRDQGSHHGEQGGCIDQGPDRGEKPQAT